MYCRSIITFRVLIDVVVLRRSNVYIKANLLNFQKKKKKAVYLFGCTGLVKIYSFFRILATQVVYLSMKGQSLYYALRLLFKVDYHL